MSAPTIRSEFERAERHLARAIAAEAALNKLRGERAATPPLVTRDALASEIAKHGPTGLVSIREGWVECECGERVPCVLDGYYLDRGREAEARAAHLADAAIAAALSENPS